MKNNKKFKRFGLILVIILVMLATVVAPVFAKGGYDEWGYNYTAGKFNGMYCDAYRDAAWCQPYKDDHLAMKWNDAWLNENRVRHEGFDTYLGSGAWLTNHQRGVYDLDGKACKWTYFVKIMAAPIDGYIEGGYWYSADGQTLGSVIWGQFYIMQSITNDGCADMHGNEFKPDIPGFGRMW